jgi:hypothetical protein
MTAAGFGGPLAGGALGAEAPVSTGPTESPSPPVTATNPQAPAPTQGPEAPASTTSTSTATAPTAPATSAPASTAPASTGTPSTGTPSTGTPSTGTPSTGTPSTPATPVAAPTVVVQHSQRTTPGRRHGASVTGAGSGGSGGQGGDTAGNQGEGAAKSAPGTVPAGAPNGVAPAPQAAGGEASELATLLAGSQVSAQALDFYRIPLFLLPVYQAAAFQYGVPWQILAAINEVETDYGTDLSVSTAGAVGWMQFMPATWLQYGVDATAAGYADPYNPVDAIFAAARYLHAAGASHDLRAAILAYNHSQEYVESVLLRARLIASYPRSVIATLTGLVDGRSPTAGAHLAPGASADLSAEPALAGGGSVSTGTSTAPDPSSAGGSSGAGGSSSATAGAVPAGSAPTPSAAGASVASSVSAHAAATPGSTPPPPPHIAAARAQAAANAPAKASQLVDLLGAPGAPVVAVEDGRIVHLGRSHALGRYLVLRDIYGDLFTYAGLGSIAPRYRPSVPRTRALPHELPRDPVPKLPASAGHQPPLTLKVKAHAASVPAPVSAPAESEGETAPAGMGRVRLYAHPNNPIARLAVARAVRSASAGSDGWRPLRTGSIVSQGTVLGHLDTPAGASAGQLRFAIRPAGDSATIDPQPLLANWRQLDAALHPKGSRSTATLLGATAEDALQMSKGELQRAVLADPGIQLDACGRRDVAAGNLDRRVLAVLELLSRSGLQPTVTALRCPRGGDSPAALSNAGSAVSAHSASLRTEAHEGGTAVDISAINGIPIAGHQGPGTVADAVIRTLLTLRGQFAPHRIVSLMKYPEAPSTEALPAAWDHIHIDFLPPRPALAHAAATGPSAAAPLAVTGDLNEAQWSQLIARIAALPKPKVATAPSSAAIRDPQAAPTNRGLGGGN